MTMLTNTQRLAPGMPTTRKGFALFLARLGRRVDRWVAAMIARRARQEALAALARLGDRELKDIGLYRSDIGDAVFWSLEAKRRMQRPEPF
jgi:uncharacterized protein YjiS (DUF1127 family)